LIGHSSPPDPRSGAENLFGYHLGDRVETLDAMPLLRQFVDQHKARQPLRGVTALLIQHQLGNQGPQIQAMMELGLQPELTYWLDIPYTSSRHFRVTVQRRHGIPKENFWVSKYSVLGRYPEYQLRRTQKVVEHFLLRPPEKLIVLDDGAYFLEAAMSFRRQLPNVAIVEQTTRGLLKMEQNAALARYARQFPIINVARSTPKITLESPWIGTSVTLSLMRHIQRLTRTSPRFALNSTSPCLVLGYGAVGRQVAAHLRRFAKVFAFDTKRARRNLAIRDGLPLWDPRSQIEAETPIQFKLVVGCTGRASFKVGDQCFLDRHAVLASASSGSVELSRSDFIDLAAASSRDDISIRDVKVPRGQIHCDLRMKMVDRSIVFLNAGFPINFDGRVNCIPSKYMQPTATLMVYGALAAAETAGKGLIEVDRTFSRELTRQFRRLLSATERQALDFCS
jgi:S-adenosylhomocysteine hydrolase